MRQFYKSAFFLLVCVIYEVAAGDFYAPVKVFDKCQGKNTGLMDAASRYATQFVECILNNKNVYCQYRCVIQKMGCLDSYFKPDKPVIQKFLDELNFFPAKQNVTDAVYACGEGHTYTEKKTCKTSREYYYCLYNKYIKLCGIREDEKNVDVASDEEQVLDDVPVSAVSGAVGGLLK